MPARALTTPEWTLVRRAQTRAQGQLTSTLRQLDLIQGPIARPTRVIGQDDPRTRTYASDTAAAFFLAHWDTPSQAHLRAVRAHFVTIQARFDRLTRDAYRHVPNAEADRDTSERPTTPRRTPPGLVHAYVIGRGFPIYLAERFFRSSAPLLERLQGSARETPPSDEVRGSMIIHELAHLALGILHAGGVQDFPSALGCMQGYRGLTYRQRVANAYVFNRFAYCASRIGNR